MLLQNKKAMVTGSSRGIGRKIAETFLAEGAEVWGMCSHPSEAKAEMEKFAADHNTKFHEFCADASNADELTAAVKAALAEAGGFDVLVNNAGITRDTLSFHMKKDDWDKVLAVNLTSVFLICQIISGDMIRKKTGLIAFSKSLAKEVGSRGVRVNCIAPGFIDTDMTRAVKEDIRTAWVEQIPLKRAGQTSDVANAALFLASDLSSYITGQVLGVDGGMGC